jgi:uncharacterized protein YukE
MLAADGGGGGTSRLKPDTPFNQKGLKDLKAMLEDANVQTVEDVAQNWLDVHDLLVGTDGAGGILKQFTDAVNKVLETWHGESAMGFASQANVIAQNFNNGAPYAKNVSDVLFSSAKSLQDAYGQVMAIQEPSLLDSGLDFIGNTMSSGAGVVGLVSNTILPGSGGVTAAIGGMFGLSTGRDETQLNADLANPNISTAQALENNRGEISEEKERSLEAAIPMEQLALTYKSNASRLVSPKSNIDERLSEQGSGKDDGNGNSNANVGAIAAVPTAVVTPSSSSYRASTGSSTGSGYTPITATSPRTDGVTGGIGSSESSRPLTGSNLTSPSTGSSIGTGLDGYTSGATTSGGTGLGSGTGTSGSYGGTGSLGGTGSSSLGATGSGTSGASGIAGASASNLGSGAAGRTGSGMGRSGMPGAAGAGGAGKGAGGAGATGRGALARQKGGIVGGATKGGKTGGGSQGGSGLHRSRGGSQAGTGSKSGRGMAGAPGSHGRGRGEEEGREGQRPDYLIEDEETWTPERNVAPRVIE